MSELTMQEHLGRQQQAATTALGDQGTAIKDSSISRAARTAKQTATQTEQHRQQYTQGQLGTETTDQTRAVRSDADSMRKGLADRINDLGTGKSIAQDSSILESERETSLIPPSII